VSATAAVTRCPVLPQAKAGAGTISAKAAAKAAHLFTASISERTRDFLNGVA
jgi:hypothetical protein